MRIIEVLVAITIVFASTLLVSNVYSIMPPPLTFERLELARQGYNILSKLDKKGILADLVYEGIHNNAWSVMAKTIEIEAGPNIFFNVTVQDESGQIVNTSQISNIQDFTEVLARAKFSSLTSYCLIGRDYTPDDYSVYAVEFYTVELVMVKVI